MEEYIGESKDIQISCLINTLEIKCNLIKIEPHQSLGSHWVLYLTQNSLANLPLPAGGCMWPGVDQRDIPASLSSRKGKGKN